MAKRDTSLPGYGGLLSFRQDFSKVKIKPKHVVMFVMVILVVVGLMHLLL